MNKPRKSNGDVQPHKKAREIQALYDFDKLPACARVPESVVCGLYGISRDTVWVRVKKGLIPEPIKQGNTTRWIVGDLRRALGAKEVEVDHLAEGA